MSVAVSDLLLLWQEAGSWVCPRLVVTPREGILICRAEDSPLVRRAHAMRSRLRTLISEGWSEDSRAVRRAHV